MGTILESTKELSKKLGVEAEEQTIKDQIDAINESIDENFGGSIDIAEAVKTYSENASGGGGGGETFDAEVEVTFTDSGIAVTVDKTYQQIKSEMDLGKTISGTLKVFHNTTMRASTELSNSYVKDFYNDTKIASDAIFIVVDPFTLNLIPGETAEGTTIIAIAISPDNKIWLAMPYEWTAIPET